MATSAAATRRIIPPPPIFHPSGQRGERCASRLTPSTTASSRSSTIKRTRKAGGPGPRVPPASVVPSPESGHLARPPREVTESGGPRNTGLRFPAAGCLAGRISPGRLASLDPIGRNVNGRSGANAANVFHRCLLTTCSGLPCGFAIRFAIPSLGGIGETLRVSPATHREGGHGRATPDSGGGYPNRGARSSVLDRVVRGVDHGHGAFPRDGGPRSGRSEGRS
jgi:hypothetical protein